MHIPRLPMAKGMEKGTKRGTTAPWSPPSLGLPLTTPGPFLLGRAILAVTARYWGGFGWSC